jgi:hypothetical protein
LSFRSMEEDSGIAVDPEGGDGFDYTDRFMLTQPGSAGETLALPREKILLTEITSDTRVPTGTFCRSRGI